jgi:hypothetical protein
LALTPRKSGGLFVRVRIELKPAKQLKRNIMRLCGRMVVYLFKRQNDVLESGEMWKKIEGLKNHSDCAAMSQQRRLLKLNRFAVQLDTPAIWNFQAGQNPQ